MRLLHLWPEADKQALVNRTAEIHREREEAEAQKQAYDGRAHAPKFRGANDEIQSLVAREFILSGPSETGKTWATLWRFDSLLRSTPGAKATLLRKVQATIYSTVMITWQAIQDLREAMGEERAQEFGGSQPKFYLYPNGARLWCGGLDKANKILSGERDFIYVNQTEELTQDDWETLITRTTGRGAVTKTPMLFGDCNPSHEDHWILKRNTLKLLYSKHKDNPSLYRDDGTLTIQGERTIRDLQSLTGIRKKRLYEGQWVGAEGLFFDEFDPEDGGLHVCEPFKVPLDWPIWGALDWGFKHPLAFGLYTEDNDSIIYKIAEHVQHQWLIPFHARAIYDIYKQFDLPVELVSQIVAGHDVFAMQGGTDDQDARTKAQKFLEAYDPVTREPLPIILEHATIDRKQGATELLTRLGNRQMGIKPTLKFFNTCKRTIATFTRVVHNPRDPEDVLKVNADPLTGEGGDDCYDETRYAVMARVNTASNLPAVGGVRGNYLTR